MAHKLYLLRRTTPNTNGHPYYNIKNFQNYVSALNTRAKCVAILDADNYRINAGICKAKLSDEKRYEVTYIIETDENFVLRRCYYVDKVTEQSGFMIYNLSLDFWGSYYLADNIEYLHITRCNRKIGVGVYDEIKIAGQEEIGTPEILHFGGSGSAHTITNLDEVMIVISLSYNVRQQTFTGDKTTTTQLFAVSLKALKDKYVAEELTGQRTIFEIAQDFLGGIFGVSGNIGTLDAEVNGAYIVLQDFISTYDGITPTIKTRSALLNKQIEFAGILPVMYGIAQDTYTLSSSNYDINYDFVAGIRYASGLKLARLTNNDLRFTIVCEARQDRLNIYVRQGQNQQDITQGFILDITTSTINTTTFRKIAGAIGEAGQAYKSISKAYEKGGISGAGISGLTTVASMVSGFSVDKNIRGDGDAYTAFNFISSHAFLPDLVVVHPICVTKYKSANDEKKHARYFGAQFDEIIEDINDLFTFDFLGEGDYDETYVIANEIRINNIPTDARNVIESAFNNGVELIDYETNTGN